MKIPRPPRWRTSPRWRALRRWWHDHHLPCLYCWLEGRGWRKETP